MSAKIDYISRQKVNHANFINISLVSLKQGRLVQSHAFNDANMKLGMNFCQVIWSCKKTLATQQFLMAAIFMVVANTVSSLNLDIIDRF